LWPNPKFQNYVKFFAAYNYYDRLIHEWTCQEPNDHLRVVRLKNLCTPKLDPRTRIISKAVAIPKAVKLDSKWKPGNERPLSRSSNTSPPRTFNVRQPVQLKLSQLLAPEKIVSNKSVPSESVSGHIKRVIHTSLSKSKVEYKQVQSKVYDQPAPTQRPSSALSQLTKTLSSANIKQQALRMPWSNAPPRLPRSRQSDFLFKSVLSKSGSMNSSQTTVVDDSGVAKFVETFGKQTRTGYPVKQNPLLPGTLTEPETESQKENRKRFELELEFVQLLSNPSYLQFLAQQRLFTDQSFLNYIKYLTYWQQPKYAKYIVYPYCLQLLDLLQDEGFRTALASADTAAFLHQKEYKVWETYLEANKPPQVTKTEAGLLDMDVDVNVNVVNVDSQDGTAPIQID
jgi:mediator of RNA polymerase II transcription subunit 31